MGPGNAEDEVVRKFDDSNFNVLYCLTMTHLNTSPCRRAAFTLSELLVVIAIIAILISVLLPAIGKARLAGRGTVCASNMRQIVVACLMYCDANKEQFPKTMDVGTDGMPTTINFWDIQQYQGALEEYISGMRGGVREDGSEGHKGNVWFDPADPDRGQKAMWGSFTDNGLITGVGGKLRDIQRNSGCVFSTLRHGKWEEVVGVPVPTNLPVGNPDDPFWASEYFDMCLDPWSESPNTGDPYMWRNGRAVPPVDLFPGAAGATAWAQQIEGRHPVVAPERRGRYGTGQWYSFCDGHVEMMTFERTYPNVLSNMWSTR
jgi:prepilin-type N-terminal cleavage/methylation domain-containing protein